MTATHNAALSWEHHSLEACLSALATADSVGDEVRRFYAVGEISAFALHSEVLQIKARADAALEKSAEKVKRTRKGLSEVDRLKAAMRSPALPANCLVLLDSDGELVVQEI